jgi:hypothetical protein
MKITRDPSIHRTREEQMIQHVEKLLADDRLRVDTTAGRRSITGFIRDVTRQDGALALKRLMTEVDVPDRELQARMPIGKTLDVTLTRTRMMFFTQISARIRVACISPTRELLLDQEPAAMGTGDVDKVLKSLPSLPVPTTVVLVSTGGFDDEARELAQRHTAQTIILVEPNEAGGWRATGPANAKDLADLFDPEGYDQKRQRVIDIIEENKVDLLTGGMSVDKIAGQAQLSPQMVEAFMQDYARQTPGLIAKRLDGRVVLFREGSSESINTDDSGGSMGLINKMRTLFGGKADTAKQVAFLSERKAALNQKRDLAYEEMGALEKQEADLKIRFKDAASEISKRRITGQMLQLRKDLERRQQTLTMLDKQITIVATDLHNLELVQHGKSAKLPDADAITEHAVEAEGILADLDVSAELAGSVGPATVGGMSDEEKALYEELSREAGAAVEKPEPEPLKKVAEPKAPEKEKPAREPAVRVPVAREPVAEKANPASAQPRRAEPEAG